MYTTQDMSAQDDCPITNFNITINSLFDKLEAKSKTDVEKANIARLKKRMSLARDAMGRDCIIKATGPYLIKYKKEIIAANDDFFMKLEVGDVYKEKIDEENSYVYDFVTGVKKCYQEMTSEEKVTIRNEVKGLLQSYAKLLLAEKQAQATKK